MATRTISALGGNWSDNAAWVELSPPTAAMDVVALPLNASGSLVVTAASVCRSVDFTGYNATLSGSGDLTVGDGTVGAFKLVAAMTITYTGALKFASTTTGNVITSAGKSLASATTFDGVGGAWTLADAFVTTGAVTLTNGSISASAAVTAPSFASSNANTRALSLGGSTWTLNGTGTVWNIGTATGMTLNQGTGTIAITDASGTNKTFAGGGLRYHNLSIASGGAGIVIIQGSNTFNAFLIAAPKSVRFTAGTTQTIGVTPTWAGTVGNLITIDTNTGGSPATLNVLGETDVICDWLSLKDSTAAGDIPFYAGANSTNVSGNTNWSFTAGPTPDAGHGIAGPHVVFGVGVVNYAFTTGVSSPYGVSQRMI